MKLNPALFAPALFLLLTPAAAPGSRPSGPGRVTTSGPADDSGFTAAWEGIWSITTVDRDCDTGTTLGMSIEQDTLCAGAFWVVDAPESLGVICSNTVDDTSLSVTCSGSSLGGGDCTLTLSYTLSGTRDGDSFTGTATRSIVSSGSCSGTFDECVDQEITGTRIAPATGCTTPALPSTWGLLKSRYARLPRGGNS